MTAYILPFVRVGVGVGGGMRVYGNVEACGCAQKFTNCVCKYPTDLSNK